MVVTIEGDKLVPYAGNIGMALVNQFEKVAINFNDCFVVFDVVCFPFLSWSSMEIGSIYVLL